MAVRLKVPNIFTFQDSRAFRYFTYGFFVALTVVSTGVAAAIIARPTLNPTAVSITLLNRDIQEICPGDELVQLVRVDVNRPSIVKTVRTIIHVETRTIILGSVAESPPFPRPKVESFEAVMSFDTPDNIPPGDYESVTAFVADSQNSETEFLIQDFTVVDCD